VMASHGHKGNSHRPIDTLQPLAEALEKSLDSDFYFGNHDGWAQRVQDKLEPDQTIVVAWHHGEMHQLVKALVAFDKAWTSESFGWPSSWPDECGAPDDWHEPGDLDGSTCYDLAWRITMKRDSSRAATWRAVAAAASLQGFHGDMQEMPCSQGLQPVKHKDYIV